MWDRIRSAIQSGNTVKLVLEWFGVWGVVTSAVVPVGLAAWGYMTAVPGPLLVAACICVFVAVLFLFQIPTLARVTARIKPSEIPDPAVWGHLPRYNLKQAACLIAGMVPTERNIPGSVDGWYRVLCEGVRSGELPRVLIPDDVHHDFANGGYQPWPGTTVQRGALKAFLEKRGERRPFLDFEPKRD